MYKGFRLLLFCLPVLCGNLLSQSLSHQVMVPAAGLGSGSDIFISQTVGETMVKLTGCSYYMLTQGFQQPSIAIMADWEKFEDVRIYPNPVADFVTIEMLGNKARSFRIEFLDLTGRVVISARKCFGSDYWYREQYNVDDLLGGLYLIRISSEDGKYCRIFKIQKI